jgi:hypothetical protein
VILNNPLIRRYRHSLMRPRQLWVYITIYVTVIGLLLLLNYAAYKQPDMLRVPVDFFESVCYQLLILQVLLLCAVGAYNSGSAIRDEITGKSYDFFRMLPLSAGKKATGILVGKNLVVLLFGLVDFALLIIFGRLGEVSAPLLQQASFALVSVAVLTNSVALLSSISPASQKKKSGMVTFVVLFLFIGPFLMRVMAAAWHLSELENVKARFYTIEVASLILAGLIALYFSVWSLIGILRKFTREDEPLFSRAGAYLFMVGYEFVLLGLFWKRLTEGGIIANWINYCYWVISLLPALTVPVWSLRSFDKYFEHIGLIRSRFAEHKSVMPQMLLYCNLSVALGLFALWTASAVGTTVMAGAELLPQLYLIWILFSFYLFLVLLLELYVVCAPLSNRIGLLLAFVALVYVTLPLILHGILDSETLYLYSPLGFLFGIFEKPNGEIAAQAGVWITNLLLCIVPVLLIWKRYLHILSARRTI